MKKTLAYIELSKREIIKILLENQAVNIQEGRNKSFATD